MCFAVLKKGVGVGMYEDGEEVEWHGEGGEKVVCGVGEELEEDGGDGGVGAGAGVGADADRVMPGCA